MLLTAIPVAELGKMNSIYVLGRPACLPNLKKIIEPCGRFFERDIYKDGKLYGTTRGLGVDMFKDRWRYETTQELGVVVFESFIFISPDFTSKRYRSLHCHCIVVLSRKGTTIDYCFGTVRLIRLLVQYKFCRVSHFLIAFLRVS